VAHLADHHNTAVIKQPRPVPTAHADCAAWDCLPGLQEECQAAVGMLEEEGRKLARSRLQYKLHPVPLYAGGVNVQHLCSRMANGC
jgi:hypothetical protein